MIEVKEGKLTIITTERSNFDKVIENLPKEYGNKVYESSLARGSVGKFVCPYEEAKVIVFGAFYRPTADIIKDFLFTKKRCPKARVLIVIY
jgi:hypothetical protein